MARSEADLKMIDSLDAPAMDSSQAMTEALLDTPRR